jgi:hypothetical protein
MAVPAWGAAMVALEPEAFPGWDSTNVCDPFVLFDPGSPTGVWKLYYSAAGRQDFNAATWGSWVVGLAKSSDGANWKKNTDTFEPVRCPPDFVPPPRVDPAQLATTFDAKSIHGAWVLKESGTYRMWYTGWNGQGGHLGNGIERKVGFRIGCATSPDGVQWTRQAGPAEGESVLGLGEPGQPDSQAAGQPCVIKTGGTFRMWYEGFDGQFWRICYATSPDGTNWARQDAALNPQGGAALDELGLRDPVVILRNSQYELWYQGRGGTAPEYRILRATSPDGVNWTRRGEVALHPDVPVMGDELIQVGSIIVQPNNSCQVFFAKHIRKEIVMTYGVIHHRKCRIYAEVVNP